MRTTYVVAEGSKHGAFENMHSDLSDTMPNNRASLQQGHANSRAAHKPLRWALSAMAVAGVVACASVGGWMGSTGALGAALLLGWVWPARRSAQAGAASESGRHAQVSGDQQGVQMMVSQIVPAWSEQVDVSRTANQDGMANLLSTFSTISGMLDKLNALFDECKPSVAPGAVGEAIDAQRPAIDALLQPMERAFKQRDAMLEQLGLCATTAGKLQQLSKEIRGVGAHTRLVAFNASIEANRTQGGQNGGQSSVATEIRALAERVVSLCDQLDAHLRPLYEATRQTHHEGLLTDTTVEELRLEAELKAREALQALLQNLGASIGGATNVQEFSRELTQHMEQMFTHFQFGDRVEQMLDIIGKDMSRFVDWSKDNPHATALDVQNWLKKLEKSYTMSEQRSQHHGTEHVTVGSQVDFF
jgi:methyl-accepting chemotaxis protein